VTAAQAVREKGPAALAVGVVGTPIARVGVAAGTVVARHMIATAAVPAAHSIVDKTKKTSRATTADLAPSQFRRVLDHNDIYG
jgi:hypothetical protein